MILNSTTPAFTFLMTFSLFIMGHMITSEESRIRKALLYIFARYIEVPLLKYSYFFLRGKWKSIGKLAPVKWLAGRLFARPFGYLADTGKPVPFAHALRLIDSIDGRIAVGPCRCRMGHRACDHPLETDMVFRTGFNAWTRAFPEQYREIDKEEAKQIISKCHSLGMFHMVFVHCPVNEYNEYVICNCCTCGCVPYIINRELGQLNYPLIDGYFMAITHRRKCTGCGECVSACPFDARSIIEGKSITSDNCYGCGLCTGVCPEDAITMHMFRDPVLPRDSGGQQPGHHRHRLYRQHHPYSE
ncbi:MAG: 4Fe-4S binding protein [Spirochaetota bacterium]